MDGVGILELVQQDPGIPLVQRTPDGLIGTQEPSGQDQQVMKGQLAFELPLLHPLRHKVGYQGDEVLHYLLAVAVDSIQQPIVEALYLSPDGLDTPTPAVLLAAPLRRQLEEPKALDLVERLGASYPFHLGDVGAKRIEVQILLKDAQVGKSP